MDEPTESNTPAEPSASWLSQAQPAVVTAAPQVFPCPQCGQLLTLGTLACPHCGILVYRERLQQLSNEALQLEPVNPMQAARVWRQCLDLLPPDSQQFAAVHQRIGALAGGWPLPPTQQGANAGGAATLEYEPRRSRPNNDPWPVALAKTTGSMLLSIVVYGYLFQSFSFAIGFTLLMLVHEMGHVVAMWYYGLSASPPIFIPFVGALINLRQSPPNAKVEAIVGIGGPIAGTIAALACYACFWFVPAMHTEGIFLLAVMGFVLNLFNLLPVPPLDGGRITAAVSPWVWLAGLGGIVALIVRDLMHHSSGWMLFLILFFALPRIRTTLASRRARDVPYYRISRAASWTIGVLYVALAGGLSYLMWQTHGFELVFR